MNRLLLHPEDLCDDRHACLRDRRLHHLRTVKRIRVGDTLPAGLLNGPVGTARVTALSGNEATLALTLDQPPIPSLPLTVVLALPRPKMLRRIFRMSAELGLERLILVNSAKVEKSYWQSPALDPDTRRRHLIDGLEQAGTTILPDVTLEKRFRPFVEDRLPALAAATRRLLAHPGVATPAPLSVSGPVTLCIGPEGGFTDFEVDLLAAQGFTPVHVGPRLLRVETALPVLVSRLCPEGVTGSVL